jgi:hypothetical protein
VELLPLLGPLVIIGIALLLAVRGTEIGLWVLRYYPWHSSPMRERDVALSRKAWRIAASGAALAGAAMLLLTVFGRNLAVWAAAALQGAPVVPWSWLVILCFAGSFPLMLVPLFVFRSVESRLTTQPDPPLLWILVMTGVLASVGVGMSLLMVAAFLIVTGN